MTSTCYQWQINKLLNSFLHTESEFQCTFLLMAHFDLNVKSSWEIFDLYFVVVWSLSHVQLFAIPWTGACQAHQLPEFTQTYVHWVSDAIQPSLPLSSPSPPALNVSQHWSLSMSQLFASSGRSLGASTSASVLPMNIQYLFPVGLTCLISLYLDFIKFMVKKVNSHTQRHLNVSQ